VGGRIQDKTGPRWVVTAGGFMVGLGLVLSGLVGDNPIGVALCFGIISGLGIGIAYGSITPTALKWFHPGKKGLVSGLVVGGFGMGALHFAPISNALLKAFSIQQTFLYMGLGVMFVSVSLAQLIKNPPQGYTPLVPKKLPDTAAKAAPKDFTWREMVRTRKFIYMMVLYLFSASVGLMIIGNISKIIALQTPIGFVPANTSAQATAAIAAEAAGLVAFLVSFMAVMNGLGRVIGGIVSDRIGRFNALYLILGLQLFNMLGFRFYTNLPLIVLGIVLTGFCFGAILSIFPAITADQYGLKNYGQNYGIIYLAWGASGLLAPLMADFLHEATKTPAYDGDFYTAYIICAIMMVVMLLVNGLLKREVAKNG
jgi:MFS family permease